MTPIKSLETTQNMPFDALSVNLTSLHGHSIGDNYYDKHNNEPFQLVLINKNRRYVLVDSQGAAFLASLHMINGLKKTNIRRIDWFAYRFSPKGHALHTPLSNFWIESDGFSLEHRFAASKTDDLKQKLEILSAYTPTEAKKLGRKAHLRSDWDRIKFPIMYNLLFNKFLVNDEARNYLLATKEMPLCETNWWNDQIWGLNLKGQGSNYLGVMLMAVRDTFLEAGW